MSSEINSKQRTKEKYTKLAKKYLTTKRILIIFIVLLVVLMFSKAFKGILLLLIFVPLAKYSVKVTAFVPHVTLETYTGSTIMMAYLYGPAAGAMSGLVLGFYGYLSNSISKFLALLNVFVAAFTGLVLGFIIKSNFFGTITFTHAFIGSIIFNNIIAYFVFLLFDPDQIQNKVYRTTHILWNCFISVLFFTLLFNLYSLI